MPELIQAEKTINPGTQPIRLLAEPQVTQHRQTGRLQQQTSPRRRGFGEPLEEGDVVSGIGKKRRRRWAGDTTSDNPDIQGSNRAQRPPLTTRHWPLT